MKNVKKIVLAASLCAAMAATAAFGTLAYFTDTKAKDNVFTTGNLTIELQEPNWNPENATNVIPHSDIKKDPRVKNDGTTDSYLQLKVTIPAEVYQRSNLNGADEIIFNMTPDSGWTRLSTEYAKTEAGTEDQTKYVVTYYYGNETTYTALVHGNTTETLFTSINFTEKLDNDDMDALRKINSGDEGADFGIKVEAYAIQTTGLEAAVANMNNVFATTTFTEAK